MCGHCKKCPDSWVWTLLILLIRTVLRLWLAHQ
jgi:hypothetical protein